MTEDFGKLATIRNMLDNEEPADALEEEEDSS